MHIALVVDNPYRDMPGVVLLATRLCQEGAVCHLVPMNLQNQELWPLAPDFVLLNYLRSNNQELARRLLEAGIGVGVLDTEGGVFTSLDAYAKTMAPDPAVRHQIACYCCWGHKLAEHCTDQQWYLPHQVIVTGCPRFDFYVLPWREASQQFSPYAAKYPRPMVLVNGNFPLANPQYQTPESEARMLVEHFGYTPEFVTEWQRVQWQTMQGLVALTNRLAARFPKVTFIYRPHPFEQADTYHGMLEDRTNLHLVKVGTVDGWILRASAVVQRSCSTAIEASMAGVPALSPVWIPTPVKEMEAAEAVSIPCSSAEEMEQQLEDVLWANGHSSRSNMVNTALEQIIWDWFCAIDGRSHKRVATAVLTYAANGDGRVALKKCRYFMYQQGSTFGSLRARLGRTLRMQLGLPPTWSFKEWRDHATPVPWDGSGKYAEKYFDAEDVRLLVDVIKTWAPPDSRGRLDRVRVYPAQESGGYHFGYRQGQSVTLLVE